VIYFEIFESKENIPSLFEAGESGPKGVQLILPK
jgi:hypothetical protein